jgi:hypothetical protein
MNRFSEADIEKLRWMAELGHSGTSIARALDRTPQAVRVKTVVLGIRLRPNRKPQALRFKVPDELVGHLHAAGSRRGMKASALARLILQMVVKDKLYDAVLDIATRNFPTVPPKKSRSGLIMLLAPRLTGSMSAPTLRASCES